MQRTLVNLIIDLTAAILVLAMIATGYVIRFPLPPGTNKALSLWGMTRHQWGEVHFWISLGLLIVLAAHLLLHWQWLVTVIRQRLHRPRSTRSYAGWATVLVLVLGSVLFAWAAHRSVRDQAEPCCDDVPVIGSSPTTPPEKSVGTNKVGWRDVYPILERSCLSCHGPKKARSNFRVDQKEDFAKLHEGKAWVIPGDPDGSPFMAIVLGTRTDIAFPERHKMSAIDAAVVRSWIAGGASFER